jgi:hypothetical protein
MGRTPGRRKKKRKWKTRRQVMVKTRTQAACPRARKQTAEVDAA